MNNRLRTIKNTLGENEVLCQLAEESAEMGQAALKLRRALDGTNPTPKSVEECEKALIEEVADVSACLMVLWGEDGLNKLRVSVETQRKLERWAKRLGVEQDA